MQSVETRKLVPDIIGRYQVFDGKVEVDSSLPFESRFGGLDLNTLFLKSLTFTKQLFKHENFNHPSDSPF